MLQISHLSADYGGKPALADINLTLESGELLVVLGPSGCGKTTLLNLIAGLMPQFQQQRLHLLAGKGVKRAEGLVQQQQLRIRRQRPGDAHP
ncbi:ATP-binding cassette domain-containing protein, partial [Klebsiella pneumoniae]|uniref:ATP-binding cassette domain-containing protein n=1 Tax=Klebsiella pneumoniae TaxID=573 RepID=UPI0039748C11